jgi:hypothetical protein
MGKYIDKFINLFDNKLNEHLNLSTKRSEEFVKVRDEQIELEKGVLLSTLKPGKKTPFLGFGGWSGHKYKDLKGLYEYIFQKDGSMHIPPEKVKGKINSDYTFFNDWIVTRATYNIILNAKNNIFVQVNNYPGKPADQDNTELIDVPAPIVERTEKITAFTPKKDFPFKVGDINVKIKDIQKWLGFTGKSVDGEFGNGTYNSLLYGGYFVVTDTNNEEITQVIYDELKRDYESGLVEKKPAAVVVPPKPDPYIEFLKKAETIKEKGGGRYWFNTFIDMVEKNYVKNPTINDKIKAVMEYCDTVFGMGNGNIDSIPEIDIIGNRAVDIYYMKNYGAVGTEYDNYMKFYSVILFDNYINMDKGALGVMARDVFPNLIPCFPEPRLIAMDTIDIDSAIDVTKKNPDDESLLLYNAFLEASEYVEQNSDVMDTIPLSENKWEVIPSAARHLLDPKWETLGEYTFEFSMEDVIKVISGPSGPGSNIFIPSYVGLTESSINVGELFREYRGEIVSPEVLEESKEETEILDMNGITEEFDYEKEDEYDSLSSEYVEVEDWSLNEGQMEALELYHDEKDAYKYTAGEYEEEASYSSDGGGSTVVSNDSGGSNNGGSVVGAGSGNQNPEGVKVVNKEGYIVNGKQKKIIDLSDRSIAQGQPTTYTYFIVHHTAGRGTAEQVINVLNTRKNKSGQPMHLSVQFIIDRDGYIYRGTKPNRTGGHVLPSKNSNNVDGIPKDIYNYNSAGCEVIAKDDSDVIVNRQGPALLKIIKHLNIPKNKIFGHGEVNDHKAKTEGITLKKYVLDNWENYKLWTGDNAIDWGWGIDK